MLKRRVFNLLLKMGVEDIDLMSYGRLFHSLGEANEKAVSFFLVRLREFWMNNLYLYMVRCGLEGLCSFSKSVR